MPPEIERPVDLDLSLNALRSQPVTDPTPATPADPAATLKTQIDQMQAANTAALQDLARQGIQINGPDTNNLNTRLIALVEYLLGDPDATPRQQDQHPRLAYELLVQEKFAELIELGNAQAAKLVEERLAQEARARLLAPAPGARPTLDRRRRLG